MCEVAVLATRPIHVHNRAAGHGEDGPAPWVGSSTVQILLCVVRTLVPMRACVGHRETRTRRMLVRLPLIPQERAFFDLFRRDIATCKAGVDALATMLHGYGDHDLKGQAAHLHEIEHEGDRLTAEIFALLNRTFVTPFEREDIIALACIIDTVLDQVDEVATMLVLFGIKQPSVYLLEASALLCRALDALSAAIDRLSTLRGLAPHVAEVHRLENEADALYHNAIAELFLPDAYGPLDVVKWMRLFDLMERAFDKCEDVGNVLENLVLKNG